MTDPEDLKGLIDEALSLLVPYSQDASLPHQGATAPLESLLAQCQSYSQRIVNASAPPLRVIHHFACTGGTLMSRALACQPNTLLLSEVDPLSTAKRGNEQFAPSDLAFLASTNLRPPTAATKIGMFCAALGVLHRDSENRGQHVILRDHTHSHFCIPSDPTQRPLIKDMLTPDFDVCNLITVRHPLDSLLALRANGWARAPVDTLDAYANRYLMFLNSYPGVDIFRYEDFVRNPDKICHDMAEVLKLDYNPRWQDLLPIVHLTGDSGRRGTHIRPRSRRSMDSLTKADLAKGSAAYEKLCAELGYDPDPAVDAFQSE